MRNSVIIVDDFSLMAELVQYNLEICGYENTTVYYDPLECLEKLDVKQCPALIISDFDMPKLNGASFLSKACSICTGAKGVIMTDDPKAAHKATHAFPVLQKGTPNFFPELLKYVTLSLGKKPVMPQSKVALP
ncbi:response regulator [Chitinispirillales bacterium ANBcel5]|uniref:response regulator n=1 Tax=Cellulosispirillum alkaliphilum TaxID=3039283 RepID=UPI002A55210C|nr:response regulator [Chitinispirillales bacterium ANBcel5]